METRRGAGNEPSLLVTVDTEGDHEWEYARHPRHGCKAHLAACWRREAEVFPSGRAAFVERYAAFSLFLRIGPFSE